MQGKNMKEGDPKIKVITNCGDPDYTETNNYTSGSGMQTRESLFYKKSNRVFIVDIRNGKVKSIKAEYK